jgi:hypothetical protein
MNRQNATPDVNAVPKMERASRNRPIDEFMRISFDPIPTTDDIGRFYRLSFDLGRTHQPRP